MSTRMEAEMVTATMPIRIELHVIPSLTLTDRQVLVGDLAGPPTPIGGELRLPGNGDGPLPAVAAGSPLLWAPPPPSWLAWSAPASTTTVAEPASDAIVVSIACTWVTFSERATAWASAR